MSSLFSELMDPFFLTDPLLGEIQHPDRSFVVIGTNICDMPPIPFFVLSPLRGRWSWLSAC